MKTMNNQKIIEIHRHSAKLVKECSVDIGGKARILSLQHNIWVRPGKLQGEVEGAGNGDNTEHSLQNVGLHSG